MQNNTKAFTLVEMLVAMAVSTIIIAATYASYDLVATQYKKNIDVAEMHTSGRAVMQMIERDVRMAGFEYRDNDAKVTYGSITAPLVIKDSGNKCCDEVTVIYDYYDEDSKKAERIRITYSSGPHPRNKGGGDKYDRYRLYKQIDVLGRNNAILVNPIIGSKDLLADFVEDFQIANIIVNSTLYTSTTYHTRITSYKPKPIAELDKNGTCGNCYVGFFDGHRTSYALAIGPEGLLYTGHAGGSNTILIFDPETTLRVGTIHNTNRIDALAFGPDGLLYTGDSGSNTIDIYQPLTRDELKKKPDCRRECRVGSIPNSGGVTAMAFGPDGLLYTGSYRTNTINIWNPQKKDFYNLKKLATIHNSGRVRALAFGADGLLYSGNAQELTIRIFKPKTLAELRKDPANLDCWTCRVAWIHNTPRIIGLAVGPDGLIYTGSAPYRSVIDIFKPKTLAQIKENPANQDCRDCRVGGMAGGYASDLAFKSNRTGQESLVSINLTLRTRNPYGKNKQFNKKDYHGGNFNFDKNDKYKRETFSSKVFVRNLAL